MNNTPSSQLLKIDYESEGFPTGCSVRNGLGVLDTSWDELLWAAITVGRPNRMYVFRYGNASMYEAFFRFSLVRMALEQSGPRAFRLHRTDAAKTLDPSEKGAVNYFLGMTLCKLFAARLLNAPWVMHLDVFRPMINAFLTGRSRPDLVGQTQTNEWVVLESKGRISTPYADAKNKAKQQASRVISINGIAPKYCIGGITYFKDDVLKYYWCDPEPFSSRRTEKIELQTKEEMWSYYYLPLVELITSQPQFHSDKILNELSSITIEALDIKIGIYQPLIENLLRKEYSKVREQCHESAEEIKSKGYHADGIQVIAGPTWRKPFIEFSEFTTA